MAEVSIGGVFVPTLLVWAVVAFVAVQILRRLFLRLGVYRLIWHRALFDLGVFFIMLYVTVSGASRWFGP